MRVENKEFNNIDDYNEWHKEQYQGGTGIKECGLNINNKQISVQYIKIRE